MLDLFIILVVIIALIQLDRVLIVFIGPTVIHSLFFSSLPGWSYFMTAGIADFAAALMLFLWLPVTKLSYRLIQLSLVSALFNGLGWVAWSLSIGAGVYEYAFLLLWSVILGVILWGSDDHDCGLAGDNLRFVALRSYRNRRSKTNQKGAISL